ncbi:hypothetical protein ACF0H5_018132 [Mactra antiquata]
MKTNEWIYKQHVAVVVLGTLRVCSACSSNNKDDTGCWYTLWYIWFVLGLFVIVIAVLIILYIKHRTKERSRARRRRRSTRTIPISIVPSGPPGYAEPSHKPPSYDEAVRTQPGTNPALQVPGIIPYYNDDYGYRPPPTSMRMAPTMPSGSPQPLPPSYDVSTQGQGQGHPT